MLQGLLNTNKAILIIIQINTNKTKLLNKKLDQLLGPPSELQNKLNLKNKTLILNIILIVILSNLILVPIFNPIKN